VCSSVSVSQRGCSGLKRTPQQRQTETFKEKKHLHYKQGEIKKAKFSVRRREEERYDSLKTKELKILKMAGKNYSSTNPANSRVNKRICTFLKMSRSNESFKIIIRKRYIYFSILVLALESSRVSL